MLVHLAYNYIPVICILPFGSTEMFDHLETLIIDCMLNHSELIFGAFLV